jgi:hypothetical protein
LLATLNWRPVVDYELREIEFERLAELNAKLSAISSSSATNSNPPKPTPGGSEM